MIRERMMCGVCVGFIALFSKNNAAEPMNAVEAIRLAGNAEDRIRCLVFDSNAQLHWLGNTQGGVSVGTNSIDFQTNAVTVIQRPSTAPANSWTRLLRASGDVTGISLGVDSTSQVYCGGRFNGRLEIDTAPLGRHLDSRGEADAFLICLDSGGATRWARGFGGTGRSAVMALSPMAENGVVVTGYFEGPGIFETVPVPGRLATQLFVARFNREGSLEWVRDIGGGESAAGLGIATDTHGISYVGGAFTTSTAILPLPLEGASPLSFESSQTARSRAKPAAAEVPDAFLAAWDATGKSIWYRPFGGPGNDRVNAVATHGNRIVAAGAVGLGATIGRLKIPAGGGLQFFVASFDLQGVPLWEAHAEGTQFSEAHAVQIDAQGNAYVAGYFNGNPQFGATQLITQGTDSFVAKCDPSGRFLWAVQSANTAIVVSEAFAVTEDGTRAALGGYTRGAPQFGNFMFSNVGGRDGFIATFVPPFDPPRLEFFRGTGDGTLRWTTPESGFVVEYRTNLLGRSVWRPLGGTPSFDAQSKEYRQTVSFEAGAQSFRLRK